MIRYGIKKAKICAQYIISSWKSFKSRNKHSLDPQNKYAFIFFAADYNNLGDLAITIAQQKFLKDTLGEEYNLIKINLSDTYDWIHAVKRLPKERVIITLIGGGNSGSAYGFIEIPRRYILKCFKNYRIISFPQTLIFDETEEARAVQNAFTRVANKCRNLTLTARERASEEMYRSISNAKVLLTPDIVFSYEKSVCKGAERDFGKAALILRNDKEKAVSAAFQEKAINLIHRRFERVVSKDTCDIVYKNDNAQELLDGYISELQTVGLVLTDRLHGMILSYITKTPCIVFTNNNWKITSTYETWLKDQSIVQIFNTETQSLSDFEKLMDKMLQQPHDVSTDLSQKFDVLFESIKENS